MPPGSVLDMQSIWSSRSTVFQSIQRQLRWSERVNSGAVSFQSHRSNLAYDGSRQHLEVELTSWERWPWSSAFGYGVFNWRNPNYFTDGCTWSQAGSHMVYGPCVQSQSGREYGSNLGRVFGRDMEHGFGPPFGYNLGQQQFEPAAGVPRPTISN